MAGKLAGKLPLRRPHLGCDPLCQRCQQTLHETEDVIAPTVERALKAMWKVVRAEYPMLTGRVPKNIGQQAPASLRRHLTEGLTDWLYDRHNRQVKTRKGQ